MVTPKDKAGPGKNGMEEFAIAGITAAKDKCLLQVELTRPTVLGALWEDAARSHLSVVAPVFSDGKVVESGGKELALELESKGYASFDEAAA